MATNAPPYPQAAGNGFAIMPAAFTANVKSDGAGTIATDLLLVWSAVTVDYLVKGITFAPVASAASTSLTATTLRAFRTTKLTTGATTPGTDVFAMGWELPWPTTNVDVSGTAIPSLYIPVNRVFSAGDGILVSTHVTPPASTAWHVNVEAQKYT